MANNIQYDPNVQQAVDSALAEQKKKKKKKKLIIFIVLAIVIVGVVAMATSGDDDSSSTTKPIDSSAVADDKDTNDDTKEQPKNEKIEAGTVVNDGDVEISYISCNANYKKYNQYSGPESGNKVVRAEFSFKNNGTSDRVLESFECYADGQKCEEFYFADDYSSPTLETLSAGRSLKGVIYFEVPESSKEIELEYETNFWSDEKIIFVIK